jgi:type II secretory pathway component PulF
MEFSYKGIDNSGKPLKSVIEAYNIEEAKKKLRNQGIFFSEINNKKDTLYGSIFSNNHKQLSVAKLSLFSRDLSVYLNAGVHLVRSLTLMKHQNKDEVTMISFLDSLIESINEGKSFAQSLESQEFYKIPAFYTGTIKISEDRGILSQVLKELSTYLIFQENIKKQLRQAMVYPSFIIVVSILMVSFMLNVVVPKITSVFETTGQALPALTQTVINAGNILSSYWILFLLTPILTIIFLTYKMTTDNNFKKKIHFIILKFPIIGKMIETGDLARFSTFSSLLIKSGIPVVNAIKMSCITLSSEVIKDVFIKASTKVVEGSSLSKSLSEIEDYKIDSSFIEAIAIGEETSEIASMLEHLSEMYVNSNKDKITMFLSILEPALMLFIGSVIGVIVISMLLPIFSLNLE